MKNWFLAMSSREKMMLALAALLTVGVLIYQFVYSPLVAGRAEAVRAYERQLVESRFVEEGLSRLERSAGEKPAATQTSESLELLLSRTANARGLQIVRIQPAEADGLLVWFDGVETRAVMSWMLDIEKSNGLTVSAFDLRRQIGQTALRGSVTVRRGN